MSALPYTKRGQQRARETGRLQSAYEDFKAWYMLRRKDWNAMGPRLPLWFRLALKRIDRRLVLQFIPPRNKDNPGGSNWPNGAWYICSRIKRTRWITRRAVFVLVDDNDEFLPPDRDMIRALRQAKRLRRRCQLDALEKEYEESMDALMREEATKSKEGLLRRVEASMRARNATAFATTRVFYPAPALA